MVTQDCRDRRRAKPSSLGVWALADPSVRLACQLRPTTDIAIIPLVPSQAGTSFLHGKSRVYPGEERYVVSMFVDMRGSTQRAADQLPFDTVFIVNRFLGAVSQAVTQAGGKVNQYLGDGLLALFGTDTDPGTACRQALKAAAQVAENVAQLNRQYAEAERHPIRFGIGVNGGEVIVGDIGYGEQYFVHGAGRRRERRRAASGYDQGARMPARGLRGSLRTGGTAERCDATKRN